MLFTNGCFDVLHAGHIELFDYAASLDPVVVVGLNSDVSVRLLKGDGRPFLSQEHRMAVLGSLRQVSDVILFDEPDPLRLIMELRPGVLLKGSEYALSAGLRPVGADFVESYGGRVVIAPPGRYVNFHSSSIRGFK